MVIIHLQTKRTSAIAEKNMLERFAYWTLEFVANRTEVCIHLRMVIVYWWRDILQSDNTSFHAMSCSIHIRSFTLIFTHGMEDMWCLTIPFETGKQMHSASAISSPGSFTYTCRTKMKFDGGEVIGISIGYKKWLSKFLAQMNYLHAITQRNILHLGIKSITETGYLCFWFQRTSIIDRSQHYFSRSLAVQLIL